MSAMRLLLCSLLLCTSVASAARVSLRGGTVEDPCDPDDESYDPTDPACADYDEDEEGPTEDGDEGEEGDEGDGDDEGPGDDEEEGDEEGGKGKGKKGGKGKGKKGKTGKGKAVMAVTMMEARTVKISVKAKTIATNGAQSVMIQKTPTTAHRMKNA